MRLWNAATGQEVKTIDVTGPDDKAPSPSVAWSPVGRILAIANQRSLMVFDAELEQTVYRDPTELAPYPHPIWSRDGREITLLDRRGLTVLNVPRREAREFHLPVLLETMSRSPDGEHLALGTEGGVLITPALTPERTAMMAHFARWKADGPRFLADNPDIASTLGLALERA